MKVAANRVPGAAPASGRIDEILQHLQRSAFRRRFRLRQADRDYLKAKGLHTVMRHAADFIEQRLAPAAPIHDGKQTPMRGHPVFVAQHATGTCCRGCLAKWHRIPEGRALAGDEQQYIRTVLQRWIETQQAANQDEGHSAQLTMKP